MSKASGAGITDVLLLSLFTYQFKNVAPFFASIFGASDPNGALATGATFLVFACVVFCVDRFIRRI